MLPAPGQVVHVRARQYLVEEVVAPPRPGDDTLVRLACLEDDAEREPLEVLWEREVDARLLGATSWDAVVRRGFDDPRLFSAYLHTLRWNCVTATDPKLFQAPYRAGIEVKAFQLEPLRKALLLPRVNLFIADDVGLGKTIEAGLILRELLLRQKVRRVVVACPPSVVRQWQEELEQRFGLTFVVYDREFVAQRRRERGYGINPWTTHTRFIVSHALLRDETYAGGLRDWLADFTPGALLILDEAHNAAPASGAKYAVDSKLTRVVRELAPRFEHRLFLSATPHNGHSNSFAALLELLDPQRFCRGVPVRGPKLLDDVMVRRLKSDIRRLEGGFPERQVEPIVIAGLPPDAPELVLAQLLAEYRAAREARLVDAPRAKQTASELVLTSLQKRLLSSIEAFACTLAVHRRAVLRQRAEAAAPPGPAPAAPAAPLLDLLAAAPDGDDERAALPEAEVDAEDAAQMEAATLAAGAAEAAARTRELALLQQMTDIAEAHRYRPDPRVERLVAWIRRELCPELPAAGAPAPARPPAWNPRRVLIFTEYADTKRYLVQQLEAAIAPSERAAERLAVFHGGMGEDAREAVKRAFNAAPQAHPLRILVATDAAREGINLQHHCADLFHFDVPWNPSRMEQRNGRLDRKGQQSPVVTCHYFVFADRAEDRVLATLVKKTAVIQRELGSLSPVVCRSLERLLERGIRPEREAALDAAIAHAERLGGSDVEKTRRIEEELEGAREREEALTRQLTRLEDLLKTSHDWLGLDDRAFQDALSAALSLVGAPPLVPVDPTEALAESATARYVFPALDRQAGADPSWAATLDALRPPRRADEPAPEWRRTAPLCPVVFRETAETPRDVVHLHLEHRVVQRLLGRFMAQGFVHHDLARACVCSSDDPRPRVLVVGRLSLYGERAARLHDELLVVAADWRPPGERGRRKLVAQARDGVSESLTLVEKSLATPRLHAVPDVVRARLQRAAPADVAELLPELQRRAEQLRSQAERRLLARGEAEARAMRGILEQQRERIAQTLAKPVQLEFDFPESERRQLEADERHWRRRLEAIAREIETEPQRIRESYVVRAHRVEPAGVVYLYPVSG